MELFQRRPDERFETLDSLLRHCRDRGKCAAASIPATDFIGSASALGRSGCERGEATGSAARITADRGKNRHSRTARERPDTTGRQSLALLP